MTSELHVLHFFECSVDALTRLALASCFANVGPDKTSTDMLCQHFYQPMDTSLMLYVNTPELSAQIDLEKRAVR